MKRFNIHEDMKHCESDERGWRSFELEARGDNLQELIEDATISEMAEDGEPLHSYGIENATEKTYNIVMDMLQQIISKKSKIGEEE